MAQSFHCIWESAHDTHESGVGRRFWGGGGHLKPKVTLSQNGACIIMKNLSENPFDLEFLPKFRKK